MDKTIKNWFAHSRYPLVATRSQSKYYFLYYQQSVIVCEPTGLNTQVLHANATLPNDFFIMKRIWILDCSWLYLVVYISVYTSYEITSISFMQFPGVPQNMRSYMPTTSKPKEQIGWLSASTHYQDQICHKNPQTRETLQKAMGSLPAMCPHSSSSRR